MDNPNVRIGAHGSHRGMPPNGWLVARLLIVSTVLTATAVLTGSAETAVATVAPLLPFVR